MKGARRYIAAALCLLGAGCGSLYESHGYGELAKSERIEAITR